MDMIDQVLWEQELAEHLHRDTKERAGLEGPDELGELAHLNGLEELDEVDDIPRAEPPVESTDYPAVAVILLLSLAIVAVSSVGWLLGYFVV